MTDLNSPVHPHCQFKTPHVEARSKFLCETASDLMYEMAEWCRARQIPFVVTETVTTIEEDRALHRVSDTHRTARAFDISVKGWLSLAFAQFSSHFDQEWGALGAVGIQAGEPELIVRHEIVCGTHDEGDHIHVQLNRKYAVSDPLKTAGTPA